MRPPMRCGGTVPVVCHNCAAWSVDGRSPRRGRLLRSPPMIGLTSINLDLSVRYADVTAFLPRIRLAATEPPNRRCTNSPGDPAQADGRPESPSTGGLGGPSARPRPPQARLMNRQEEDGEDKDDRHG